MPMQRFAKLCLIAVLAVPSLADAQAATAPSARTIVATIDTTKVSEPISQYEYGMFIEHIGSLIYRSLWSEMLDDRKFHFPISSKEPESAGQAQGGPMRNMQLRKWRPVGPDEFVVMDKDQPLVGDQSPRIELDAATPHGIRQSGLALVKILRLVFGKLGPIKDSSLLPIHGYRFIFNMMSDFKTDGRTRVGGGGRKSATTPCKDRQGG